MANIQPSEGVFKFKGISSADMDVYMLELPTRPVAAEKGESKDVEGTDGELWLTNHNYKSITVKVKLECGPNADIDRVNAWLRGYGDLVFMDEPDRAYHAKITAGSDRSHKSARRKNRSWTQSFVCDPFRYEAEPRNRSINQSGVEITNPGTMESLPLLLMGVNADTATISFGGVNELTVTGFRGNLYVDCAAKVAYTMNGTQMTLRNDVCSGSWPVIPPGTSTIAFTGLVAVTIKSRWRWY